MMLLRGVETSSSVRSEPTPKVLAFLCLSFSGRNARPHPDQCREGDEYNTRKGNKSAVSLSRFEPPGATPIVVIRKNQ